MPLQTISFGLWGGSNPTTSCLLIGSDGDHFIVGRTDFATTGFPVRVGHAESGTLVLDISHATWQAELAARQPLAALMTMSGFVLPVQGSPYFIIPGAYLDLGSAEQQFGGVLYRIDSDASIVAVGSFAYGCGVNTGPTVQGVAYGAGVLDSAPGFVFVIAEGGYVSSSTNEVLLIRLAISETDITNLSLGAIDAISTKLATTGAAHAFVGPLPSERTDSEGNLYTVVPDPDKEVGLIKHVGLAATPAVWYGAVDIGEDLGDHGDAGPSFTGSYITDISVPLGLPWADEGNHLDLSPSTDDHDGYTAPSPLGGGRVVFLRSDSAATGEVFGRIFDINGADSIVDLGTIQFTHNSEIIAEFIQAIDAFRVPASTTVIVGMRTDFRWIFGDTEIATAPAPSTECGPEDTADAAQECLFDWDECALVPTHITIELVAPTVSPGRSLTGREVVVQPDAGCIRVTLHEVPVWTNAQQYLWREYQLALNGRVGTCCIPLYEGKLSGTPIVATLGADAAIGAVRLTINQSAGADIRPGMHFQVGERAYRLVSGSGSSWKVLPPLRDAITSGASLNFNDPRMRGRLETDDGMDLLLTHLKFGKRDVRFMEDV